MIRNWKVFGMILLAAALLAWPAVSAAWACPETAGQTVLAATGRLGEEMQGSGAVISLAKAPVAAQVFVGITVLVCVLFAVFPLLSDREEDELDLL